MSEKRTSRKTRFVAGKKLVDAETGEELEAQVVEVEQRDFDFKKIWLAHILEAIDELGSAKMKVLGFLFDSMNYENVVIGTVREIAEAADVSTYTVTKTLQILDESDVIQRRTGMVMLNPDVIFRGGHGKRMNVLMRYKQMDGDRKDGPKNGPKFNANRSSKALGKSKDPDMLNAQNHDK